MSLKIYGIFVVLGLFGAGATTVHARQAQVEKNQQNMDLQIILTAQDKINQKGFEKALQESSWPELPTGAEENEPEKKSQPNNPQGEQSLNVLLGLDQNSSNDLPWDDCNFNPTGFGCSPFSSSPTINSQAMQLKDDAVQILAVEVLYQTLSFFKVKNVFGKIPNKGNTYGFKVLNALEGQPYQDLDTEGVIYAIKQFRKYVIGLLCNQPNPSRVLAMMNSFDVGKRFRWDMAWALMGNDLPDAPNKYMTFGVKWRKFSAAMDGIENVSVMRVRNAAGGFTQIGGEFGGLSGGAQGAGQVGAGQGGAGASGVIKAGLIAKEIVGAIRLVGDLVSALLDLVCVSDLSVNQAKEQQKQEVIYKLLEVKKRAYDHYGPLRPILEEIGKKATDAAGRPITVFP